MRFDEDGEPRPPKAYEQEKTVPLDKLSESTEISAYTEFLLTDDEIQAGEVDVLDLTGRILSEARIELSSSKIRVSENDDCKYCQAKIICPIFSEGKQVIA
jgi:hypothetical protein